MMRLETKFNFFEVTTMSNNKLTDAEIAERIPYTSFDLDSAESFGAIQQMQEQEE